MPRFVRGLSSDQLCNRGAAGDSRDATPGTKADIGDHGALPAEGKFQNVTACRIFQASHTIRGYDFSCISRILKMVEKFRRIHQAIVPCGPLLAEPMNHGLTFTMAECKNIRSRNSIRSGLPAYSRAQP